MTNKTEPTELTRRLALQRLGLAFGAAYAAPVVLNLSDARASSGGGSGGSGGGGGGAGGAGGNSGGSSSMPSEPSMSTDPISGPSGGDSAASGGTGDGTAGTTVRQTASAVAKVPGKIVNGVKSLFRR